MRFKGLFVPQTAAEAVEAFQKANGEAFYVNGGTDVMVVAREKDRFDNKLGIDLSNLSELKTIRDEGDSLVIGAGCTHSQIAASLPVPAATYGSSDPFVWASLRLFWTT